MRGRARAATGLISPRRCAEVPREINRCSSSGQNCEAGRPSAQAQPFVPSRGSFVFVHPAAEFLKLMKQGRMTSPRPQRVNVRRAVSPEPDDRGLEPSSIRLEIENSELNSDGDDFELVEHQSNILCLRRTFPIHRSPRRNPLRGLRQFYELPPRGNEITIRFHPDDMLKSGTPSCYRALADNSPKCDDRREYAGKENGAHVHGLIIKNARRTCNQA